MKLLAWFSYPNWSIACRVATAMMLAAIVPITILACFNLQQITSVMTSGEYDRLELLANNAAARFDRLLIDREQLAATTASRSDVVKFLAASKSTPPVLPKLAEIVTAYPDIEAILLLDRHGLCLTSTTKEFIGQHYTLPNTTIFSLLHSNIRDYPGIFVTQANSLSIERSGKVLLKLRGAEIWSVVNRDLASKAGQFFVVDSHGTIVGHQQPSLLYQQSPPELSNKIGTGSSGHIVKQIDSGKMPLTIGFTTLANQPWLLGVSRSDEEFQAPILATIWLNLGETIVVGGVVVLVAASIGLYISRPIHALTLAVQSLEQQESDELFEQIERDLAKYAKSSDDVGQLVRAFLRMTDELHRRDSQLKTQVQSLRIEVDRTRRDRDVAEIIDSEQFQLLQQKIQQMRSQERKVAVTETDYFQQLQQQVQSLKQIGKSNDLSGA
jgi:HAMP domain-containing protein